jgi:erythromycin esterase-like protein
VRRALILSLLLTVLLWPQTVRNGSLAPSDDSRAEFTKLYSAIDAAYSAGRFDDVAAYFMPDAIVRRGGQDTPFRNALAQFRQVASEAKVTWKSKVVSVVLNGEEATVTVESDFALASPADKQDFRGTSRDTWMRQSDGWRLRQSEWLKQERVVAPTDAETTKQVVRDLKCYAVRLASFEPGKELGDLAAFGRAVGDARIVALGEASHGTREFFQMKHRLLEYLVREKGFTVLAIEANWPESLAVDRYIKSGEGDPKAAIKEMYFWTWGTQEVLDLIEWMRAFNKAPGDHPILTFTSFDMQQALWPPPWRWAIFVRCRRRMRRKRKHL